MKTTEIKVTSQGLGMEEALAATEALAADGGLGHKETLRLRLLAEELFGMIRSIVGDVEALYWAEQVGRLCIIHLKSDMTLTQETRRALIDLSTQGENAAAKGFMGKLRDMIAAATLPKDDSTPLLYMGLMSMGSPGGYRAGGDYTWSLQEYRQGIDADPDQEGAAAARDELEKSIVASIADEVAISISGSLVEISIMKTF